MSITKRSRAVVSMVRNESVFLPIWLKYYSQFFSSEDIYVLDHETSDGSTSCPGFVRIPVSHLVVDWGWHRDKIQQLQHDLIQRYDMVLCTDVDEIVAPHPDKGTLGDYMDQFTAEFVNCTGYEVLHLKDAEQPFDLSRPVFEQRFHWFFNPVYSKPLLARVPMYWHGGLHSRVDGQVVEDTSLYLIHLHRVDYDICLSRHKQRFEQLWNQRDLDEGWGYQNRIVEDDRFDHWFYNDSCGNVPIKIEKIPVFMKGLV
jgi:hypothetical protein